MDRIKSLDNMKPDAISYNSLIYALVQEPWVSEVGQPDRLIFLYTLSRVLASGAALQHCWTRRMGSTFLVNNSNFVTTCN